MSAFGQARTWLRTVLRRGASEKEMHREMHLHIEQATERFVARGMPAPDALRAARVEFGNLAYLQEEAREARGARWVDNLFVDVRYACRYFARTPLTTLTIVITLTLGIGINSAAFTIANSVLRQPAPGVPHDDALVRVRGIRSEGGRQYGRLMSWPELQAMAASRSFSAVAAWTASEVIVDYGDGEAQVNTIHAQYVTPNFFRALGLQLVAGSGFLQHEFSELQVPELDAIMGYGYAIDRFGSASAALNKQLRLNDRVIRIVGVAPRRFNGAVQSDAKRTIWLPMSAMTVVENIGSGSITSAESVYFDAFARLRPAMKLRQATSSVANAVAVSRTVSRADKPTMAFTGDAVPLRGDTDIHPFGTDSAIVASMSATVLLLILLVCTTTVSSLLVGAAITRRHEIAVRLSLGASRRRILRQLITESAILSLFSGASGLGIFAICVQVFAGELREIDVTLSWYTAGFSAGFAVFTAMLCALSPALHATRGALTDALKDSSAGIAVQSRLQRTFVVAQIALTQPLLIGLAMLVATFVHEVRGQNGSELADRLVVVNFDPLSSNGARSAHKIPALADRFASLPGVVNAIPKMGSYWQYTLQAVPPRSVDGAVLPTRTIEVRAFSNAPGFFAIMGIPVVRGRDFNASDATATLPPIIIGSDLAVELFGDANPVGRRLVRVFGPAKADEVEVIGIVPPTRNGDNAIQSDEHREVYTSLRRDADPAEQPTSILIRTIAPAERLLPTLAAIAKRDAPFLPNNMHTFAQSARLQRNTVLQASAASAVGGMLTLFLAAIGLYAVVALAIGQRRREIGIRIAMGARPKQVVVLFFKSGIKLSVMGIAIGLPISAAVLKVLSLQVGVMFNNMGIVASLVAAVVVGVASLASWIPARRALRIDPVVALRTD